MLIGVGRKRKMINWVSVPGDLENSWIYKRSRIFDILCKEILECASWEVKVHVSHHLSIPCGPDKGERAMGFFRRSENTIYLDSKSAMSTFLHEVSHAFSAFEKTRSHKEYNHLIPWHKREEEQKAMLEERLLRKLSKICGSKTPKAKREKTLVKLRKTWRNYRRSVYKRFA